MNGIYGAFGYSKSLPRVLKKLVIRSHVFKLRPLFYAHGRIVHVVYARAAHGENEGRMGCDYKLAAVKARAVA